MQNNYRNSMTLPLPSTKTMKKETKRARRSALHNAFSERPATQVKREDFPAQASFHFTRTRRVLLSIVLSGVTVSLFLSFFFLFSGGLPHLALHVPVLFPWVLNMGLLGEGAGLGIFLWVTISSFLKRFGGPALAQNTSASPYSVGSGQAVTFPPEPVGGRTGTLFPFDFGMERNQRGTSEREREPSRKDTDKLEATHVRQRLQTLQLFYAGAFPDERGTDQYYQIKRVDGKLFVQRKTDDALLYKHAGGEMVYQ